MPQEPYLLPMPEMGAVSKQSLTLPPSGEKEREPEYAK